jgi:hypothetical protein
MVTKLNIWSKEAKMLTAATGVFSAPFFLACLPFNAACAATGVYARTVASEDCTAVPTEHAQ